MARQKALSIGAFLHSFAQPTVLQAIGAAKKAGIKNVQLGPVTDEYLVGGDAPDRRGDIVNALREASVVPVEGCFCFETPGGRGGVEVYASIESIARTGGFGYVGDCTSQVLGERLQLAKDHVDLFKYLGRSDVGVPRKRVISTHVGFFNREDQEGQIKDNVRDLLRYCARNGTYLAIETGSERMEELVDFIEAMEKEPGIKGRLGINYDPANFLMYGTQDPLEALGYLKNNDYRRLLFGVHIKDAVEGEIIGVAKGDWKGGGEVPVGSGSVKWAQTMLLLYELGYKGPLIIEREGELAADTGKIVPFGPGETAQPGKRAYDIKHAAVNTERAQASARSILLAS